jgi:GR25 family glycosyltransferase involved in LPS biosynthesis
MIFNYFDMVYYINLNSRPDRREQFERRATEAGISQFIRFPAIHLSMEEANALPNITKHDGDDNRHLKVSSSLSHFAVIADAKKCGYESILIFEDDAVFVDEFEEKIKPVVDELKEITDWDLVYFGVVRNRSSSTAPIPVWMSRNIFARLTVCGVFMPPRFIVGSLTKCWQVIPRTPTPWIYSTFTIHPTSANT